MTDIDFDELDRAVNSLMDKREQVQEPATPAQPVVDTATVQPQPPLITPAPKEAFVAPAPQNTSAAGAAVIAKRPAGRFMDVVHPSSDMTNARPAPSPSARPSRVGATLTPPAPSGDVFMAPHDTVTPQSEAVTPVQEPVESTPAVPASEASTEVSPTELAMEPPVAEDNNMATDLDSADELSQKISESLQESSMGAAPMETPFLADAVVDKKPLGDGAGEAMNVAMANELQAAIEQDAAEPVVDADNQPAAEAEGAPSGQILAPEFDKEVMDIESRDITASNQSQATTPALTTGADIPQQYTALPDDTPEQEPMFDAATVAPQALSHEPKEGLGILKVLLYIAACALIGAAGGAVAYLFLIK